MRLHCLKLVWRNDAADSRYGTSEMPPTAYVRRRLHWLKERTYSCVGSRSLNMNANSMQVVIYLTISHQLQITTLQVVSSKFLRLFLGIHIL